MAKTPRRKKFSNRPGSEPGGEGAGAQGRVRVSEAYSPPADPWAVQPEYTQCVFISYRQVLTRARPLFCKSFYRNALTFSLSMVCGLLLYPCSAGGFCNDFRNMPRRVRTQQSLPMAVKLSVRKSSGIIENDLKWAELLPGKLFRCSFRLLNTEKDRMAR